MTRGKFVVSLVCLAVIGFSAFQTALSWNLFTMLNYATGWNLSADQYMKIGMRIQTLRQLFNIKCGKQPKDFIMNGRVKGDPQLTGGALKGITLSIDEMVRLYWKNMKWNENTGVPEDQVLCDLQLKEFL